MKNIDDKNLENVSGAGIPGELEEGPQAQASDVRMNPGKNPEPPRGREEAETDGQGGTGGFSNPFQQ